MCIIPNPFSLRVNLKQQARSSFFLYQKEAIIVCVGYVKTLWKEDPT